MGSHDFQKATYTAASARDAYRDMCDDAAHEYGYSGSNGTISTTEGFRVVDVAPMTMAQARRIVNDRIDTLNKWDLCEAIPLVAETPAEYESLGTREVEVTLTGAALNDQAALFTALAKTLKVKPENIEHARVKYDLASGRRHAEVTPKVTAVAPKEKTETRYFALRAGEQQMPKWEDGHATQAEARAALTGLLHWGYDGIPQVEAEVISMTRRVSGEPLVKATVEARKVTATYQVSLRRLTKKATAGTTRAGWLFYGWAAS